MNTKNGITILLIGLIIASIAVPIRQGHEWLLFWNMLLYAALGFAISKKTSTGLLEDEERNTWPARLQMFVWSIVVLASLSTALSFNFHGGYAGCPDPTVIDVPAALWILLGVAGVTIAGEQATKKNDRVEGLLSSKRIPLNASAMDENRSFWPEQMEVEKLQFILFLTITVTAFVLESFRMFDGNCIEGLPELSDTMAILGGVSSGAYVAARWGR